MKAFLLAHPPGSFVVPHVRSLVTNDAVPFVAPSHLVAKESGNMLIMIAALAQKQGPNSTAWLKSCLDTAIEIQRSV